MILCVGCYTPGAEAHGIHLFSLDTAGGEMKPLGSVANNKSPSFIAFNRERTYAYAGQELDAEASVTAYRLEEGGTKWVELNQTIVPGCGMCHVCLSPKEDYLLCSNFTAGNVAVCEVLEDGRLGATVQNLQLTGKSIRTDWFQDRSRCHEAVFTPDGKHLVVADLGGDQMMVYDFDADTGLCTPNSTQAVLIADPGDGPRHVAFSRDGKMMYSVSEISADVVVYAYDAQACRFERLQKIRTVPDEFEGWCTASEIMLPGDGRFVFISNRGNDTIVRWRVLPDGRLEEKPVFFDSLGPETRMFCFTPDDRFVVIANQKSDQVSVCAYDAHGGTIGEVVSRISIQKPAFVEAWK